MNACKNSRIAALVISLCALTYFSFNCVGRKTDTVLSNLKGKDINGFTGNVVLMDSAENMIDVSNFTGSVHILEFYTTDCKGCSERQKVLRKLAGSVYLKSPVRVVMINSGGEDSFEEFTSNIHRNSFQLYDVGGEFTRNLQIGEFPASVLIDSQGVIRYFSMGEETHDANNFFEESKVRIDSLLADMPQTQ
jgi:hypothetical protein